MAPLTLVEVDLSELGIRLPRTGVGMVLAQPHLTLTQREPYRCTGRAKPRHLQAISSALRVACDTPDGAAKTHFTLFPEYSIPGMEGVELVEAELRGDSWPRQTVVIGGTDGISSAEYAALTDAADTQVGSGGHGPPIVPADQWVNCGIIWAKGADGGVRRWLQPKLAAAWPEKKLANEEMYTGSSLFLFKGKFETVGQYRFGVLVCFDWVAEIDGKTPWRAMIDTLSAKATGVEGGELPLSWLFVIQHNRWPSHESFMEQVNRFFDHRIASNVRRDRTGLVFANSAGRVGPGKTATYGKTSVIFASQTLFKEVDCKPTFCMGGRRFRGHGIIEPHKDFLFRENGACIHSFEQVDPDAVVAGPAGATIALRNPCVHPTDGGSDPRTPGGPVPASVKWLNDELDSVTSLADDYADADLAAFVRRSHSDTVSGFRRMRGSGAHGAITLACARREASAGEVSEVRARHADEWCAAERAAVTHLVHTISILSVCSERCEVAAGEEIHARLGTASGEFDVVAVRGATHEACKDHYQSLLRGGRYPVILISRDRDNNERLERLGSFVEPPEHFPERRFTEPNDISWQLGYRDLLDIFRQAKSIREARERFDEKRPY